MTERIDFFLKLVSQLQETINFLIKSNSQSIQEDKVDRLERLVQSLIKSLAGARKQITYMQDELNRFVRNREECMMISQLPDDALLDACPTTGCEQSEDSFRRMSTNEFLFTLTPYKENDSTTDSL